MSLNTTPFPSLKFLASCAKTRSHLRSTQTRHLSIPAVSPHAYLRPLIPPDSDPKSAELEGIMSLVLDRKDARNALSVRMVGVSFHTACSPRLYRFSGHGRLTEVTGDARFPRQAIFLHLVRSPADGYRPHRLIRNCWNRARLLLLHSAHAGMFCAGADLRERTTMSPSDVSTFLDSLRSLLSELEAVRIPTIGVIDGFALGGGCELALGCDIRIAGGFNSSTRFKPSV